MTNDELLCRLMSELKGLLLESFVESRQADLARKGNFMTLQLERGVNLGERIVQAARLPPGEINVPKPQQPPPQGIQAPRPPIIQPRPAAPVNGHHPQPQKVK